METAGKGGYTSGTIMLKKQTTIYIYVGGSGQNATKNYTNTKGGCNGGGKGGKSYEGKYYDGGGGGGATDFRLSPLIKDRILVSGGGGGTGGLNHGTGGYGGCTKAGNAERNPFTSYGGTQETGRENGVGDNGRDAKQATNDDAEGNGGCGGGYRGGIASTSIEMGSDVGRSGGSSYISGHSECTTYPG